MTKSNSRLRQQCSKLCNIVVGVLSLAPCYVRKKQVRDKGVPSSYHHGKAVSSLVDDCQTMHPPLQTSEKQNRSFTSLQMRHAHTHTYTYITNCFLHPVHISVTHYQSDTPVHAHTYTHTQTHPPSLSYFVFPCCWSMLSLRLVQLLTCGVIRSYNSWFAMV